MEKDNAVKDFLDEFGEQKEVNPFEDNLKDPFIKQEIVEDTAEENKDEKPIPFNKDPKVQKFIEREINKRMAEFTPAESVKETTKENDEVVDALIAVIGNDTPEKRRAVQALRDRLDEGTKKITEWENQQKQAEIADREAEEELASAFDNIEETYDVDISSNAPQAKKLRQEFAVFVEKIAPKDKYGDVIDYPDMNSAWETFNEIKKANAQPNRAKELASRGLARSSEAPVVRTGQKITFDNVLENLGA